uniref:C-type lectin domain-containing protein n=1 Tax=Caenorhabditis tropicalis TaxID=1561998 RepID=A0A1I7TQ01_9PELO
MNFLLLPLVVALASADTCLDSGDRLVNGRCFTLVNQQLSWQDARNWCHYRNPVAPSSLATIPDTTTANFIASYARTSFNTNEGFFWIGLSRNSSTGRFQWDDGTTLGWTNFGPQNAYTYVAESITNAKFSTYTADAKFNFVCSYYPNAVPTWAPYTGSTDASSITETTSLASTEYTTPPGISVLNFN